MSLKMKKKFFALLSLIVLIPLAFTFFHHHTDGHDADCQVCAFIKLIAYAFSLFILVLEGLVRKENFVVTTEFQFSPQFSGSNLQGRAPPVLS